FNFSKRFKMKLLSSVFALLLLSVLTMNFVVNYAEDAPMLPDGLNTNVESIITSDFLFTVKDEAMVTQVGSTFSYFFDEVGQVTAQYSKEENTYYFAFIGVKDNAPVAHAFIASKEEVTGSFLKVLQNPTFSSSNCLRAFIGSGGCPGGCRPPCDFTGPCFTQICGSGPQCDC
ncbi:MAG: hypothetical protein AAF598_20840, partial [Bacteroidota bacterium]